MSAEINYEIDSIIEQLNRLKHAVQLNCRNANTSAIELLPSKIKLSSRDSSTESRKKSPKETPKKDRFRVKTLTKADLSPETLAMLAAPTEKIKEKPKKSPKEKIKKSPESPFTVQHKKSRFTVKHISHISPEKGGVSRKKYE
jgi:hypothetical protein